MAAVALELTTIELVHHLTLFSRALGRVTLGLANGMMETLLSLPFCRNSVSTTKLTDATPSPHLRHVALLGHQDGVAILV